MIRFSTFVILLLAIGQCAFPQIEFNYIDSTCRCLNDLLKDKKQKTDFAFGLEKCISICYSQTLVYNSSERIAQVLSNLEDQLRNNCESYNRCQQILEKMTLEKTESKIVNSKICDIMRIGDFEDLSGNERVIVSMMDSIQIVRFEKTGFYTKSKVIWKDECSFSLILIKSTNPYENLMLKPGFERVIRIIEIKDGKEVTLETGYSGRWFLSRMIKL